MSLKCCNKNVQILKEVDLFDTKSQTHRFLVIGRCKNPNCGALRAQIIYFDVRKGKFVKETIRSKDVKATIDSLQNNPFLQLGDLNPKEGSLAKLNWVYGKTKLVQENEQTYIEDWAIDFNGEKRLVSKRLKEK